VHSFGIIVPNFMTIVQVVLRNSNFSIFFHMAAAAILDFQKLEFLTVSQLWEMNVICLQPAISPQTIW